MDLAEARRRYAAKRKIRTSGQIKGATTRAAQANIAWHKIRAFLDEGHTVEQAAARFGRSPAGVLKTIYKRTGSYMTYPSSMETRSARRQARA